MNICRFKTQLPLASMFAVLMAGAGSHAQDSANYLAPRTEHGQPDFQGTWHAGSLTFFERPGFFQTLAVSEEQEQQWVTLMKDSQSGLEDPDVYLQNISSLNRVNGEIRSSMIVDPADGKLPHSEAGLELVEWSRDRLENGFDGPEQRPLDERCMSTMGMPPYRLFLQDIPKKIVQTADHVLIYTEDQMARIIPLGADQTREIPPSYFGTASGHWEGETLVVHTRNFRDTDPVRLAITGTLLVGTQTEIVERFTRVSASELHYEFTLSDPEYYSQPWRAEMTFIASMAKVYEYACHEGNYSLPGILLGGRRGQLEQD